MELPKNVITSKATMAIRAVFRGKRKRRSPLNTAQNSTLKLLKNNDSKLPQSCQNKVAPKTWSKETGFSDKSKIRRLIRRFEKKRESLSADNISKGHRTENEKFVLILIENEKLKRKIKNQNRQLEDLKRQLNSERSVYEDKIEYLNTLSDNGSQNKMKFNNLITVSVQTCNDLELDYFPNETLSDQGNGNLNIEDLQRQLYRQTLVTKCVCSKYIKLKTFKDTLMEKMAKSDSFYKMFISEIMQNFEECRIAFALAKSNSLDKGSINHLIEKNARLAYNNAAMQLELQKLEKEKKLAKSAPVISQRDDDFDIIKAVKAKSYEYTLERRPSSSFYSNILSKNNILNIDCQSNSGLSLPQHQVSICGTVISVPVTVVNNGKVTYRMTPMFEAVTDLKTESKQSVSINCDKSFSKIFDYRPELVVPAQNLIQPEPSQMSLTKLIAPNM